MRTLAKAPQSLSTCSLDAFIARDSEAIGFDRSALVAEFCGRSGSRVLSYGNAMVIVRDGRTARHLGPVLADNPAGALALVNAVVQSENGPLLLDAVSWHDEFLGGLLGSGWIIERPFQRMRFGHPTAPAEVLPFAVAGPEFG